MLFSRFTDPFEKKVYKFLHKISTNTPKQEITRRLRAFMQEDLVRTNLVLEWKFKRYKIPHKRSRKKLYQNTEILVGRFQEFAETHTNTRLTSRDAYLDVIRQFLHPKTNLTYKPGTSFHRLLRNPKKEKLVGDCNQITTLYIYLYSLRFPITDLQLKVPDGHVCLHYEDKDLETTTGEWVHHAKYKRITSVEEIIPINLLDISDSSERKFDLSSLNKLKAAELAYQLSQERKLVEHNLRVAYHNCSIDHLRKQNYSRALKYAKAAENKRLIKKIIHDQAVYYLKRDRFSRARKNFGQIDSPPGLRMADQYELRYYLSKIDHCKSISDYRSKKSELNKIRRLARKLERKKLIEFCNKILAKL